MRQKNNSVLIPEGNNISSTRVVVLIEDTPLGGGAIPLMLHRSLYHQKND